MEQKKYQEAEELFRRNLKITEQAEKIQGRHPMYLLERTDLGTLLWKTGRAAEAEKLFKKALELPPDEHFPQAYADAYQRYSQFLRSQGRVDEAKRFEDLEKNLRTAPAVPFVLNRGKHSEGK